MLGCCRARAEKAAAAETRDAAEMQTNMVAPELGLLPAPDADASADGLDLAAVLRRVKDVVRVLENFKQLRDPARSRAEYVDQVRTALPSRVQSCSTEHCSQWSMLVPAAFQPHKGLARDCENGWHHRVKLGHLRRPQCCLHLEFMC